MKSLLIAAFVICGSALGFGQSFEAALSGGPTQLSGASITPSLTGVPGSGDAVKLDNGWNLGFRATLNSWGIFGIEFGYIYDRTHLLIGGADQGGMAIHNGFGDGVVHLTKEGSRIRPFAAGGLNFSNFVLPGSSAQYGGGQNKFGFNYGAGIKVKVTGIWMVRFDVRQFNTGKPDFGIPGVSGRLLQNQFSIGVGVGI
jgi:opacity protein-like surface antigen